MGTATKEAVKGKEVEYYDLLVFIRAYIDSKYGGVAQFFETDDCHKKCGFKKTNEEKTKLMSYLSLPKDGESKKILSAPTMKKLFKGLFDVDVESKTVVTRTTLVFISEDLKKLRKRYLK